MLLALLFASAACNVVTPDPPLPTSAATAPPVAANVTRTLPVEATAVPPSIPTTNTPAVFLPNISSGAGATSSAPPTNTPQPTGTVPTSTPKPSATATFTPVPSETAYVTFMPTRAPVGDLGDSKMGIHIAWNNSPDIMDFIRQTQPAVVKSVGDFGLLAVVKEVSPNTVTIGRIQSPTQDYTDDPEQAARDFVAAQLNQYLLNPTVDYWEGWNEPDPNLDNMGWYARMEAERVRLLASYGLKAAIGGFPVGVPELNEFVLFLPAIEEAKRYQGILTLHEGGSPTIDYLYGDPLPGYPAYPDRGSLSFRYRWYYREYLEPLDLVIPLVISELAIDGQAMAGNRPGPVGLGWRDFEDYWVQQGIWGGSGVEAYVNQLAWYDAGARQDGYVIGFAIFTAGGSPGWESWDINPIFSELAGYILSQK